MAAAEDLLTVLGPEEPPQRSEGYSIRERAGGDPVKALELADWHARKLLAVQEDIEAKRELVRREIERLQLWLQREEERAAKEIDWHTGVLEQFMRDFPPPKGKTQRLPCGAKLKLRKTRPRTEIVEKALMELCRQRDDLFNALVEFVPRLDRKAVRERFKVEEGKVVDALTGEVMEPVRYTDDDGRQVQSPIIVVTEPAGERFEIEPPQEGKSEEGDTNGDSQEA